MQDTISLPEPMPQTPAIIGHLIPPTPPPPPPLGVGSSYSSINSHTGGFGSGISRVAIIKSTSTSSPAPTVL